MKLRIFILISLLRFGSLAEGQITPATGEITDSRDGKTYQTIEIESIVWLTENMKYETLNVHVSGANDYGINADNYYYPYEEADSVCPDGYRLPNLSDWEAYIKFIMELKNIPQDSVDFFEVDNTSGISETYNKLLLFEDPNPLSLAESGIIQGSKLISDEAMNFWTRVEGSADTKYHLHVLTNYYFNHTHKHHIKARKKKKRKMLVRCVKK